MYISILKTKPHHMGGPSAHVHLDHNSSPYDLSNLMISEEFRSCIFQECTHVRSAVEFDWRKGDKYRTNYTDLNPFSREEIDSYLVLILDNGINMKPQMNSWFLRNYDSTIYGKNNFSKLFPRGRLRWDELKILYCIYNPRIYPKSDSTKHYLFNVRSMLQHLQRNFELHWDPAIDFSIDEQTIGFQGRHKDKLRIYVQRFRFWFPSWWFLW